MQPLQTDLLVVGGGINGVGIARDAAGRGLNVTLCEQGDLAGATSSASSKMIHGGLRYLEHGEFRLVREALQEREVLLRLAPHIIWPIRLVLPHSRAQRPAWMIRLGLFLYDHLGGRSLLPRTRRLDLARTPEGAPIRLEYSTAFEYSDCWVDDSRLVVLNAIDARERGATIHTRTRCVTAHREGGLWHAELEDLVTGTTRQVTARALVNAAGPWVTDMLERSHVTSRRHARLVKGSHIVLPRLYDGPQAYLLQNDDKRVVFVLPFQNDFSLVGTTDLPFEGDPARISIDAAETAYLCQVVSTYFRRGITPADVVRSFAGVRPLYDDAAANLSAVTRDYVLDIDLDDGQAPMLSVFGGKITTYRRLAEHAVEKLAPYLAPPRPAPWTSGAPLPGGDIPDGGFERLARDFQAEHPWLPADTCLRLLRAYGTRAERVLNGATSLDGLGADLGAGLSEAELRYLVREEWAREADDVLWRRTKLQLRTGPAEQTQIANALKQIHTNVC